MAIGPGKYDDACTVAREATKARAIMLIVFGGEHGNGFSAQISDPDILRHMPSILEDIAAQIRTDNEVI